MIADGMAKPSHLDPTPPVLPRSWHATAAAPPDAAQERAETPAAAGADEWAGRTTAAVRVIMIEDAAGCLPPQVHRQPVSEGC